MSVQAKGQPAAIVPATTQTPRAVIPTEIKNERTVSMMGPNDRRGLALREYLRCFGSTGIRSGRCFSAPFDL
jgi:hypothetical protein